ncbi:uncharacterized protein EDB91DRAFT_488338 [Suillus paluster]|uniref:uncharacterized protein n=1 Tax=Suillus paluster TaxID=48578 RepID=UPI001B88704A|nr:uncharacterized protein EDB91DRAFT_488338 [Suillus paluster]KAG1737074.1 hypothetical protein EDB91DRAFT_488338 [Suillus paluster]
MAAVDLVLRRSSRIAQHPHQTSKRRPTTIPELDTESGDSSTSETDELTPRALRALKRQRLTVDSDGLLVSHIHRRKRRKENDNNAAALDDVKETHHIPPMQLDLPLSTSSPVTSQESIRTVLTDQPSILAPKDDVSPPPPPIQVDLDALIPLDPLPEFPHTSPDFQSNASFNSEFPSDPFSSNTLPFGSSQPTLPGAFGSNLNPGSFSTGFGSHSHEFIPAQSQPDFQDNAFSSTPGFSSPTGFQSNGFPPQSNEYAQSNESNGYPQQGTFSQPHTNSYEYAPVPHRDREVNIWKLACQERVEFLLRRYGIDTIKALVASEARARYPSPSSTRFRLYTPASYLERASYTYKSAEFEAVDFDMDDEDDEDDDLDGAEYDEDCDYDEDDEDGEGEGLFLMDVGREGVIVPPCVPAILLPEVPSIAPMTPVITESIPQRSPTRSTSPPAVTMLSPHPRPLCTSPPCTPLPLIRRTPSPPSTPPRFPAPSIPMSTLPTLPSTPAPQLPSTSPPPQMPTTAPPTPQIPIPIPTPQIPTQTHPPSTPPQTHQPTLPRTPPLSSLHVTLLSEPPRAFMGRGTPPDRRRLSEWGRWGCVQVYGGKGGERRVVHGHGENLHTEQAQHVDNLSSQHVEQAQHGEQSNENPPLQHNENPPPPPHEETHHTLTNTHTHTVPGEWTSFLFAMLEGDGTGAGWYELGASVGVQSGQNGEIPQSMGGMGSSQGLDALGVLGGSQNMGVLGPSQGMSASQSMGVLGASQTVGEADSTLRFALG